MTNLAAQSMRFSWSRASCTTPAPPMPMRAPISQVLPSMVIVSPSTDRSYVGAFNSLVAVSQRAATLIDSAVPMACQVSALVLAVVTCCRRTCHTLSVVGSSLAARGSIVRQLKRNGRIIPVTQLDMGDVLADIGHRVRHGDHHDVFLLTSELSLPLVKGVVGEGNKDVWAAFRRVRPARVSGVGASSTLSPYSASNAAVLTWSTSCWRFR